MPGDLIQASPSILKKSAAELQTAINDVRSTVDSLSRREVHVENGGTIRIDAGVDTSDLTSYLGGLSDTLINQAAKFEAIDQGGSGRIARINSIILKWIESANKLPFFTKLAFISIPGLNAILGLSHLLRKDYRNIAPILPFYKYRPEYCIAPETFIPKANSGSIPSTINTGEKTIKYYSSPFNLMSASQRNIKEKGNLVGDIVFTGSTAMIEGLLWNEIRLADGQTGWVHQKDLEAATSPSVDNSGGFDDSKIIDKTSKTPLYNEKTKIGNYRKGRTQQIDSIVLHGTGGSTASGAISTLQNPSRVASAHYVIDKDGTIYRLVSDDDTAFHATWYNDHSIGIEVVQKQLEKPTADGYYEPYTPAQLDATKGLVLSLAKKYNVKPESILSHQIVDKMAKDAGLKRPNWSGKTDGNEALDEIRTYIQTNLKG